MSFDLGFNFRDSAAFVTDGANETYQLTNQDTNGGAYPITRGGATFGFEDTNVSDSRDRSAAVNRRLAGMTFWNASGKRWRLDLPASGAVTIHFAGGDPLSSGSPANFDFKDTTTVLGSVTGSGANFVDATDAEYSAANWPGSEAGLAVTFATTVFRLVSSNASTNCICHLRVVQAAVATQTLGVIGGGVGDYLICG